MCSARWVAVWLLGVVAGSAAAAGNVQRQFDVLFGEDVKRVRATSGTTDDAELANHMFSAVKTLEEKSPLRVLIYEKTYELGIRNKVGHASAAQAIQALGALQPKRKLECQEKLMEVYRLEYAQARGTKKRPAAEKLLMQTIAVGDALAREGQATRAIGLYRRALALAQLLRSSLRKAILDKVRAATDAQKRQIWAASMAARLEKDSGDAEARSALINYYIVETDDPAKAVKLINADVDEILRSYVPLAAKPMAKVTPDACFELGAWYRGLSVKASGVGKVATLKRARAYYGRFLEGKSKNATQRLKAKLDLQKISKDLAALGGEGEMGIPLSGAVLIMTFDEGSLFTKSGHTCVRDYSGLGNHGVVFGAKLTEGGQAGKAMTFNGTSDYIAFGNPAGLQNTGSQTIAVWLRPRRSDYSTRAVYSKWFGGEGSVTLYYGGSLYYYYGTGGRSSYYYDYQSFSTASRVFSMSSSSSSRKKKPPPLPWKHVAVVRDLRLSRLRWYVNGSLTDEATAKYTKIKSTTKNAYLGKSVSTNRSAKNFLGGMDELVVFSRALSAQEIQALYKHGQAGKSLR